MAAPSTRRSDETPRPAPNASRQPEHVAGALDREAEHELPRVRTRSRRSTLQEDMFYIPTDEIPEGLSYEWKRFSTYGMEDPFYLAEMRRQGWEPVDPKRHPTWVPPGYSMPHIIKGGMLLMERPIELTNEARIEARQLSMQQIREAEQRLGMTPKDTMTRDHQGVKPRIQQEVMRPISIEE